MNNNHAMFPLTIYFFNIMDIYGDTFYPSLSLVLFCLIYPSFYLGLAILIALNGT